MSQIVTIEIPDAVAERAQAIATATNRRLEDTLVEWIGRAVAEPIVESLSDQELLSLCDTKLDEQQQVLLTDLLARHREGNLTESDRAKLDSVMLPYRRGLVLKARALKEAVSRGLIPPLSTDAA